ncbi:MAG TPA: hypothetical protein PL052_06270 [Synergistales bacterium]|nr:hypothetical protein [Synergistales bacterium]
MEVAKGRSGRVMLFLFLFLGWSLYPDRRAETAQAQVDAVAFSKAVQSMAALRVETKSGGVNTGMAFVVGDGDRAVTDARLLNDAARITLHFQDGSEVLSPGVLAVDGERGLALIDAPVKGGEGLSLEPAEIARGAMVHCGATRDGVFGFIKLSVAEVRQGAGKIERYILSGEAPWGNSGAPALDKKGNVTGVVIETPGGRVLIPSAFIAVMVFGSAPGQQAGVAAPSAGSPPVEPDTGLSEEADQAILDFLAVLFNHESVYLWAEVATGGTGFIQGVPQAFYDHQVRLETALRKLGGITSGDPLRDKVMKNLQEAGQNQVAMGNYFIQAVIQGQRTEDWGAEPQHLNKLAKAAYNIKREVLLLGFPDIQELYGLSAVLNGKMPRDVRYGLGLEKRPTPFALGAVTTTGDPFHLLVLSKGSFGESLGLREGDRVLSAGGVKFCADGSLEDFKVIIMKNSGKTISVAVERDGRVADLEMIIPGEVPGKFLYSSTSK